LIETGQRDLLLTALLSAAYAVLFTGLRAAAHLAPPPRSRFPTAWRLPATATAAGLLLGTGVLVKPFTLLLVPVLLAMGTATLRQRRQPWRRFLAGGIAGTALPMLAALVWLVSIGALGAFFSTMHWLAPLHAAILRLPLSVLLQRSVSSVLLPLFCLGLPLFIARRGWQGSQTSDRANSSRDGAGFENRALLAGFLFGVLSFCLQGRGYPYHRYPSELSFLVLLVRELHAALDPVQGLATQSPRIARWQQVLAAICVLLAVFGVVPRSVAKAAHYDWQRNSFAALLQPELEHLGRQAGEQNDAPAALHDQDHPNPLSSLNHQVQCLDMAGGCLEVLYRMRLVQSTGYLYDCYLFVPVSGAQEQAEQQHYRAAFFAAIEQARPRYLVVTSDECGIGPVDFAYRKLARWPRFHTWLAQHYTVLNQQAPTLPEAWEGARALPYGFRIYASR
jgi:hypothetical protein